MRSDIESSTTQSKIEEFHILDPVRSDIESSARQSRIKEFRILDPRVGQNFGSIILFDRSFDVPFCLAIVFRKLKTNPQQFRQWLLTCDSEHLTINLLAQLNKSLPSPENLKKFSELKNEINDLLDSEQYFCAVSLYFTNDFYFIYIDKRYKPFTSTYWNTIV